jgi:ubiquinone/menaquinone biosynthesis C-methylase UbiE
LYIEGVFMADSQPHPDYVIHTDEEPLRLERQARLYDISAEVERLELAGCSRVLDAGCGSGAMARSIARAAPQAEVVGIDREARYIDFARRKAAEEGLKNLRFEVADVTALPLPSDHFDRVWSKHLLQWVGRREAAIAEFVRVTRPGGRVLCANFDQFFVAQYPVDPLLQPQLEHWMESAADAFGFDNRMGPKLPLLMRRAGLIDVGFDIAPDTAFCGFGGDPERVWNWEVQVRGSSAFSEKIFGGVEAARDFNERLMRRLRDPDVFVSCQMYYVHGRKAVRG